MSLKKILKKIIDDAQDEAEKINVESQKKAEEIRKRAQKEAEQIAETLVKEAERQGRLEASRLVTQARLEKKIKILSSKRQLIEEVLEKAFKEGTSGMREIKRKIILKDGEKEEPYAEEKLKEELRFALENDIIEALGI